jgi:outer membrane lipoprotein SlyB
MPIKKNISVLLLSISVVLTSGCASTLQQLPVRTGTINTAAQSVCKEFKPNVGGAVVGAAAGGVVGHQIGNGNGRRAATALGILAGALAGAAAGGTEVNVPCAILFITDDDTGEKFTTKAKGQWNAGMKTQFSVKSDGKVVLR